MTTLFTNIKPNAADEGEQLRIVSAFVATVRGAHASVLLKLGTQRLADLTAAIQKEQDALVEQAKQVKAAINSSLSVAQLAALGDTRLRELARTAGASLHGFSGVGRHVGYSINGVQDEVLRAFQRNTEP